LFERYSVRYLVIGGYAVMFHAEPRFTKDIDLLISVEGENLQRFSEALTEFGFPLSDSNRQAFARPNCIIEPGRPPSRIDFLNEIPGVDFASAWNRRVTAALGELTIDFIGLEDLIAAKRATSRPQDLLDLAHLEAAQMRRNHP
jgi:hypothetical protein